MSLRYKTFTIVIVNHHQYDHQMTERLRGVVVGGRCLSPPAPATSFIRSIMFIIIAPEREGECREEEKEIMPPTWVLHQKFRGATGVLCKKLRGILGYFTRKGWHRCFSILVRGGQAGLGQLEAKQVDRWVVRTAPISSDPLKLLHIMRILDHIIVAMISVVNCF